MEMMAHVGLQPEPEQEKRLLQKCIDPLWVSEKERPGASEAGEGRWRLGEGKEDMAGSDFWRERDEETGGSGF